MAKRSKEPHFSPEFFRFLRQLHENNNRPWFEKNKERYLDSVRDPMLAFIADFAPKLARISKHLVADPRPSGGSLFRIYRDTRFAKDKTPYKTHAAARFGHEQGKDVHSPGFYLSLGLDGVHLGSGIWRPDGPGLQGIRERIVADPARWKRIRDGKPFKSGGLVLEGESLKRPPKGFDPEHPLIDDLKRKDFVGMLNLTEKDACAPDFLDRYVAFCKSATPLVRFLCEGVGVPW